MNEASLCPACGAANACALANPSTATQPCWCYGVSIEASVLAALPEALRNKACLCPRCARVLDQLPADDPACASTDS